MAPPLTRLCSLLRPWQTGHANQNPQSPLELADDHRRLQGRELEGKVLSTIFLSTKMLMRMSSTKWASKNARCNLSPPLPLLGIVLNVCFCNPTIHSFYLSPIYLLCSDSCCGISPLLIVAVILFVLTFFAALSCVCNNMMMQYRYWGGLW